MTDLRKRLERELQVKEYYEFKDRIYFLSVSGSIVSLPKHQYFERYRRLQSHFADRDPVKARRLIKENMAIGATPLPREYHKPRVEVFRYNLGGCTFKITGYDEDDPQWGDNKDIILRKSFPNMRGNKLEDLKDNPWRTERNDWFWELAKKVKREIFGSD